MPGEKTEPATAKKRREERRSGNVPKSQDINVVVSLIIAVYVFSIQGSSMIESIQAFYFFCFNLMIEGGDKIIYDNGAMIFDEYVSTMISVIATPLLILLFTSILINGYQTKWLVTTKPLKPKLSKLNPISGLKKIFSLKSLVEALKSLVKISLLLYIIFDFYVDNVLKYKLFYSLPPVESSLILLEDVVSLVMKIVLYFSFIAAFDYKFTTWKHEKDLRMSKDDIKEEFKQMEGDPKVKAKIKQKQMQMAQSRMMNNVPKADFVVRNPTHYAIAFRFKEGIDAAPIILAIGKDNLALRIIKLAEKHNIPIAEDVPLARALYSVGEVNTPVPEELFEAMAIIMVNVLGMNGKKY